MDNGSAREWLAAKGMAQADDGDWVLLAADGMEKRFSANEMAHYWTPKVLDDDSMDAPARMRLALDMLDLFDDYAVTMYLGKYHRDPELSAMFWDAYRRRLEAPEPAEAITYSLWVDWFEDRSTAAEAFAEVIGDALGDGREPLLRLAARVLECSGPVLWPIKHAAYEVAATVPELHLALFRGILGSQGDIYGDVEPGPALSLLERLDLPEDTEFLQGLRRTLEMRRARAVGQ